MEQLEELFDACDTTHSGKVPVSKLILAVTNDAFNNNDHQQHEKEEILQTVRYLLDPSEQDVGVDKATWMAAWHKQAESPSPKKSKVYNISDLAGGDDLGIGDEYQGPLDVSKQSYCFSPSSRSSSVEDTEEVVLLKEEIQLLQCALKTQKHQLQKLEDALNQEQIEKQELEKLKDAEVNKLSRQNKSLLESNELLKCSLEGSESEKLELCESLSATERQLNLQLTEQKRVVAELSSELEDSNQEIENLKSNIKELQIKLEHQANVQQEQMLDYQKTIQNYIEEKNELRSQITNSVLHKRHVSSYSDDLDSSGISNLESELAPFNFQANSMLLSDSPPSLQKSLLVEMQALSCHAETQTEQDFNVTPPIPLELIDKCIQVEVDSEEVVLLKEEIQQLQCALKFQKQQLQKLEDALNQAQIEKQELEKLKDAEVNKLSQQILSPVERNEIPKTSVSMSDREEHDLCKSFDSLSVTERQSNLEQKRLVAASSTEIEDLNQENENFTSYIPELQTKLELRTNVYQEQMIDYQGRIRNHQEEEIELSSQITSFYADTQTQGVLTVSSLIPLERVDQGIQAEVQMCSVDSQTSPQAPENDYKLCSSRFFSKYFLQKLPLTNATDVARKSPDLSLKISDKQGSVHNKFSSALPHKSSCLWVIFIFVAFFVLLIISTIFCTGAVLNIASDAGVMSYPYAGPTSDFVERIFKPFVKIKLRPVGNNVPV